MRKELVWSIVFLAGLVVGRAEADPQALTKASASPAAPGALSGRPAAVEMQATALAKRAIETVSVDTGAITRSSGSDIFGRTVRGVVKVLTNDGEGSGVILSNAGLVLTNWHVVEGYRRVGVRLFPDSASARTADQVYLATVIRTDELADLALIKLDTPPPGLAVIRGAATVPPVGSDVHAIGHPKGQDWSYTRGYVSQVRPNYQWVYVDGTKHKAEVVQTQTPINPGNSGGPLFDDQAQLIGINSFGDMKAQGLNYAVSINEVKAFLARSGDRTAPREPKAGTGPKVLRTVDTNNDGRPDSEVVDINGDGKADGVYADEDGDGAVDRIYGDADGNGNIDFWIVPGASGSLTYYFDPDEDGNANAIGADADGDGEPESVRPLR